MSPNKTKLIILGFLSIVALTVFFYFIFPAWASIGHLDVYRGKTEILRKESIKNGKTGENIKINDVLRLETDSRSGLVLKDNTVIRFEAVSTVEVAELEYKDGKIKNAVFSLTLGRVWVSAQSVGDNGELRIETPSLVASVRGTEFEVIYRDGKNEVFVFSGSISVALFSNPSETKNVKAGEHFVIRDNFVDEDFKRGPSSFDTDKKDDWIIFNIERSNEYKDAQTILISPPISPLPPATIVPEPEFPQTPVAPILPSLPNSSVPTALPSATKTLSLPTGLETAPKVSETPAPLQLEIRSVE